MSLLLVLLLACPPAPDTGTPDTGSPDTGTPDIPEREASEPHLVADVGDTLWVAEGCYWTAGANTLLTGVIPAIDETFTVTVGADVRAGGRLPVEAVLWTRVNTEETGGYEFQFTIGAGEGEIVVDGLDATGTRLWAHLEGDIELADTAGGYPWRPLEGLLLQSVEQF